MEFKRKWKLKVETAPSESHMRSHIENPSFFFFLAIELKGKKARQKCSVTDILFPMRRVCITEANQKHSFNSWLECFGAKTYRTATETPACAALCIASMYQLEHSTA